MRQRIPAPGEAAESVAAQPPIAPAALRALSPTHVLALQRTVGNRAVTRLLAAGPRAVQRTPDEAAAYAKDHDLVLDSLDYEGVLAFVKAKHKDDPQNLDRIGLLKSWNNGLAEGGDVKTIPWPDDLTMDTVPSVEPKRRTPKKKAQEPRRKRGESDDKPPPKKSVPPPKVVSESAKLLEKLARPQVGLGPSIPVQQKLVDRLEGLIAKHEIGGQNGGKGPSVMDVGGFFVDKLAPLEDLEPLRGRWGRTQTETDADKQLRSVIEPELFALPNGGAIKRVVNPDFGPDAVRAGLGPLIVENTLRTMIDAEQIKYLRSAGLPNDEWTILVNVHYYRDRNQDMAGFHKDTTGQTLFVNLNYHVEDDQAKKKKDRGLAVRGPEFVVNPPKSEEHDKLISGRMFTGTRGDTAGLPGQFQQDLGHTRDALGTPKMIQSAGIVTPYGYVAFVDEAIHHATPFFEHRYVTGEEFKSYLERAKSTRLTEIRAATAEKRAIDAKIIPVKEQKTWRIWLDMIGDTELTKKYTRAELAETMTDRQFREMLQNVGAAAKQTPETRLGGAMAGFHAGNMSNPFSTRDEDKIYEPLTHDKRALRRESSQTDLLAQLPGPLPDHVKRRFFRTWVRAVRRDQIKKT